MSKKKMTFSEVQPRLDALALAMADKGLREPDATLMVRSQSMPTILLGWRKGASGYDLKHKHLDTLDEADAWVAALPSPEEARMTAFLTSLDETIQLGKKADVEVEFINPMLEIFKRISKNAITHQAADLGVEVLP